MAKFTAYALLVCLLHAAPAAAIDNGLGRTPPMGWRSWNCYHSAISQDKMTIAANAMVDKSRGVSLLEMGYENCGLDDYYQACRTGAQGSFHNASGYPLIDHSKFPDMKAMTDHAHSIGLKMGWYGNNCGCNEHQNVPSWGPPQTTGKLAFGKGPLTDGLYHYQSEIQATIDLGFDGIKLDGCGEFLNLTVFAELMNRTGKPILVENCHWGKDGPGDWGDGAGLNQGPNKVPEEKWCPFNFFRTSGDIGPSWGRVMGNLQSVIRHQPWDNATKVRTGPGCFAYPDMLEVGNLATFEEDRAHFGAWCIVSAPLILGHDLADNATNHKIWPIITNKAAISVSQSFAEGDRMHPGGLVATVTPKPGPPPPPKPSPPPSGAKYLWGVPSKVSGWSVPTAGGSPGPVKHTPSGMCLVAPKLSHAEIVLAACDGSAGQNLQLDANGNLRASGTGDLCTAFFNWEGPQVIAWACNDGENEEVFFDATSTSICSKGDNKHHGARCFDVQSTPPPSGGGGGGGGGSSGDVQIWAKPQPNGAVAVLFINNAETSAPMVEATVDFTDVRFTPGSGEVKIFDIWAGSNSTLPATATSFTSDSFSGHDSRFYLLSV